MKKYIIMVAIAMGLIAGVETTGASGGGSTKTHHQANNTAAPLSTKKTKTTNEIGMCHNPEGEGGGCAT